MNSDAFSTFSKIVELPDLPVTKYGLNKGSVHLPKLLGTGVTFRAHEEEIFDVVGFYAEQPILVTISVQGGIKLWTATGDNLMHFVLPTFIKISNELPKCLALKHTRSLQRSSILL